MANILNIGQTGLAAAQVGITTAGHNIANAATPGYSRQTVVQTTGIPQFFGYGFVGSGTDVSTIKRVYNDFLGNQVSSAQASSSELSTYATQINQIDNLLGDQSSGLAPALQDFFNGMQTLASDPGSVPARQSVLSSADSLATRFNTLDSRLEEISQGVNAQVTSSIGLINSYASQLAKLNDSIVKAQNGTGQPPNDLLDQRDQLINDLSKEVKVTVVKQDGGQYNVFIGNGLPLVVGTTAYSLQATPSRTDPTRTEVGYVTAGSTVVLGTSSLSGGTLGALLNFRNDTLDTAQNALGRIAIALTDSFNAQHQLGQDLNGQLGGNFFKPIAPQVDTSTKNTGSGVVAATILDSSQLTGSDYRIKYDGTQYTLIRSSDNTSSTFTTFPQTIDGVQISLASGTPAAGDEFTIRPTAAGGSGFGVLINDVSKLAAGAPVRTAQTAANTGSGKISAGSVNANYLVSPLSSPVTLTYDGTNNQLTGFPATQAVTVTINGVPTTYAAAAPVPYTAGATISFGGISFVLSGTPADTDTFTVGPNTSGAGDSRNALLLAGLQSSKTLGNTSYQGAYAQLISQIGTKANEVQTTSAAADKLLNDANQSQQSVSGVNLDEEAADLIRYQQAYQASAKVMQIASSLFDTLLTLGN